MRSALVTVAGVAGLLLPFAGAAATTPPTTGAIASASASSTTPAPSGTTTPAADPFNWQPFAEGVDDRTQQGTLTVPLDYANPTGSTIELFMVRHLADPATRLGTMVVNPGGPGFGGSFLAAGSIGMFSPDLVDAFDIIAFDPRGTGLSTPAIDCIDDEQYDRFFAEADITPDDPAALEQLRSLAKEFADGCATRNAEFLQFMGTNNSARDIDAIRQALGEDTLTYFGFSYGSELGATWATLFPTTVRAAVLDGASDPTASALDASVQQTAGFNSTLNSFLAWCTKEGSSCPFGDGAAEAAFDALMTRLDATPIPSVDGRPKVNLAVALQAAASAMYSQMDWPMLAQSLADAQRGDGAGLLQLFDQYYERQVDGTYDNSMEAFQAISCMDDHERVPVAQEDIDAEVVNAAAPRISPPGTRSYFCTFFPPSRDPRVPITGAGAGPIVVVGTTGDPATPLESSRRMASALQDGRFVTVEADEHTGYTINHCSRSTVDQYLLDPIGHAPPDGTMCSTG